MSKLTTNYIIDENGDVWIRVPDLKMDASKCEISSNIDSAILSKSLNGNLTATDVARVIGLLFPTKSDLNKISSHLRFLRIKQKRTGLGKFFIF